MELDFDAIEALLSMYSLAFSFLLYLCFYYLCTFSYEWFKKSGGSQFKQIFDRKNLRIFRNGTMTILGTDKLSRLPFGTYQCKAINTYGASTTPFIDVKIASRYISS